MHVVRNVGVVLGLLLFGVSCASTTSRPTSVDSGYLSINGWSPSETVAAAIERYAEIGSIEEIGKEIHALPPEERMTLLRAGLRSRDLDVASMCVHLLDYENHGIDFAESRRAAEVIIESSFRGDGAYPLALSKLLEFGNADDMNVVYERLLEVEDTEDGNRYLHAENGITWLHKLTWGKHIPLLVRLLNRHDGPIADACYENLLLAIAYSDRNRQRVARCLLRENNNPLIHGAGADPGLAGMVDLVFWHPTEIDDSLHEFGAGWIRRWLVDAKLDVRAAPWLTALAARTNRYSDTWTLARVADEDSGEFLRKLAETNRREIALGVLAARGEDDAFESLARTPDADLEADPESESEAVRLDFALEILFAADPVRARERLAELLLRPQSEAIFEEALREAKRVVENGSLWGLRPKPSWFEGFEERAINSSVSGGRLARIGASVAGCRTHRLAREAVRRLQQDPRDVASLEGEWDRDYAALAYLETSAPKAWRSLLRSWAFGSEPELRNLACRVLMTIGDSESADALVAWLRGSESKTDFVDVFHYDADEPKLWTRLSRSPAPASRAYLWEMFERCCETDDGEGVSATLQAIAHLEGLPRDVPLFGDDDDAPNLRELDEERAAVLLREAEACLRDGRPVDAFVAVLRANPERGVPGAGSVHDPRVTEYLRELQRKRHLELYRYATAELAIQGDAAAREETWKAIRSGQYRWRDHLRGRQLTLGFDFNATLGGLLATLESNCCMRTAVEGLTLGNLLSMYPQRGYTSAVTPAEEIRLRLAFHDDYAWSWTAGSFVPVER